MLPHEVSSDHRKHTLGGNSPDNHLASLAWVQHNSPCPSFHPSFHILCSLYPCIGGHVRIAKRGGTQAQGSAQARAQVRALAQAQGRGSGRAQAA